MSKRPVWWVLGAAMLAIGGLAVPADGAVSDTRIRVYSVAELSRDGSGGDLNNDGRDDLLVYRETRYDDDDTIVTLTALSGTDGDRLWSRNIRQSYETNLIVMRVGSPARVGVVVAEPATRQTATGSSYETWVTALSGSTGRRLWGSWATMDEYNPGRFAILPGLRGRASRIVFEDNVSRPAVLFGDDGHRWTPPAEVLLSTGWSFVGAIGDVDNDGYSDFATSGTPAGLLAYSSTSGTPLWSQSELTGTFTTWRDGTGDKVADVIVGGRHALDGATGTELFSVPNGSLRQLGDINDDGKTDLVHISSANGTRDTAAWTRLAARLAPNGKQAWVETVRSPEGGRARVDTLADLDGDRVTDFVLKLRQPPAPTTTMLVFGDDGKARILTRGLGDSLNESVDGRGVDFARDDSVCPDPCRSYYKTLNTVRVRDGRTAATLLVVEVEGVLQGIRAMHANRDQHADLVTSWEPERDKHSVRVYDGETGEIRWTIRV